MSAGASDRKGGEAGSPGPPDALRSDRVPEEEALGRPLLPADLTAAYGSDELQVGDLRLPDAPGPHPVAVLLHGGCWRNIADRRYMEPLAAVLTDAGWATWNLEYRSVDHRGGGWPGTFQDVADGLDHLRRLAADPPLDLGRVVTIGHSAGGHLALWAAARPRVAGERSRDPLPVAGVVGLAGIADLETFGADGRGGCQGAVRALLGASPAERPDLCAVASPGRLLPLGVPQLLVVGEEDDVVPAEHVRQYGARAGGAGDPVDVVVVDRAGHFEVVAPWWSRWEVVWTRILAFLDRA